MCMHHVRGPQVAVGEDHSVGGVGDGEEEGEGGTESGRDQHVERVEVESLRLTHAHETHTQTHTKTHRHTIKLLFALI